MLVIRLTKLVVFFPILVLICVIGCTASPELDMENTSEIVIAQPTSTNESVEDVEPKYATETIETNLEIQVLPCGLQLVPLGKQLGLDEDCIPEELILLASSVAFADCYLIPEAAEALINLISAAEQHDHLLVAVSCYRSYQYQKEVYERNIREIGEEQTALEVALAGHSEHQLGTTVDISSSDVGFELTQVFGATPGGEWLNKNASNFGFVLSYPEGFEDRTGYVYEPWHFRWVGVALARAIESSGLTVEEYLKTIW